MLEVPPVESAELSLRNVQRLMDLVCGGDATLGGFGPITRDLADALPDTKAIDSTVIDVWQ